MSSANRSNEAQSSPVSLSRQLRQYHALRRSEQSRLFSKNDHRKVGAPEEAPYGSPMQPFVKQCLIERQRIRKLQGEDYGYTKALENYQQRERQNLECLRQSIYWDGTWLGRENEKRDYDGPVKEWIDELGEERERIREVEGKDRRVGKIALAGYWKRYKIDRRFLDLWVSSGIFDG